MSPFMGQNLSIAAGSPARAAIYPSYQKTKSNHLINLHRKSSIPLPIPPPPPKVGQKVLLGITVTCFFLTSLPVEREKLRQPVEDS